MEINYRTVCDCVRRYRKLKKQGYYVSIMCDYETCEMWCDAYLNANDYKLYDCDNIFNVRHEYYNEYFDYLDVDSIKIYDFLKNYERRD